jgi:hypothetical protein
VPTPICGTIFINSILLIFDVKYFAIFIVAKK